MVDSQDTFRNKDAWIKFMPNISKLKDSTSKSEKEESKQVNPDLETPEKLQVAWRYNNLLDQK